MMSILIVNQSVVDMLASFFTLITSVVEKRRTGLSRDSIHHQFMCRFWNTNRPLWCMLITSTYAILLTTLSRYVAVIYPMMYKTVRIPYCIREVKYLLKRYG